MDENVKAAQSSYLYSSGPSIVPGNNTGTITTTRTIPHTATLVNPIYAKRFHRHYRGQPALLNRHYRGITTGVLTFPSIVVAFSSVKDVEEPHRRQPDTKHAALQKILHATNCNA